MAYCTLVDALLAAPPQTPFITTWSDEDEFRTVTFGEFIGLAKSQAANFQAHGIKTGDRVILIMPQGIPLMASFAGAMLAGAVPAILAYPNFKVDAEKYSSGLAGVSQNLQARLIVLDEEFPAEFSDHLALARGAQLLRCGDFTVASSDDAKLSRDRPSSESLAFIQHSAGTTGLQKGVALSHAAVMTQLDHLATVLEISAEDRLYSWLPLYHDMGLIACFMLPLAYHVPIVMQSPIEWVIRPGTMLQLISEYHCTLAWVPNFALQFLARRVRQEDRNYDLSRLRALINCSEPVRAQSIDEFISAYGKCGLRPDALKSSYAMAENVFAVTQSEMSAASPRIVIDGKELSQRNVAVPLTDGAAQGVCFVSSGRCLPGNNLRIVSTEGRELSDGEVGEILIQSDSLFDGYYNRPDLSAAVINDGWYSTGDLGFHLDGELYVIGRKKDLILVAGKNIYPQDLEEIVCRHPAIHDGRAIAFGLYNENRGTEDIVVAAELEKETEANAASKIEQFLRNAIVTELDVAPRAIFLMPPGWIVKSTAGKPARSNTREKLLAEHPELIEVNWHGRSEEQSASSTNDRLRGS